MSNTTVVNEGIENEVLNISSPDIVNQIKEELNKSSDDTDNNMTIEKNETENENEKENASKTLDGAVSRPPYIPPHLMGRDLNNPAQDMVGTGRRVQKPRLGVKVPYRNLTSQIVSQDEIAQEILERSLRKYSYTDVPEGGDVFFAMKLTHRLANKINVSNDSTDRIEKKADNVDTMKAIPMEKKDVPKSVETPAESSKADETLMTNTSINSEVPSVINCEEIEKPTEKIKDESTRNFESKAEELYAEISSTLSEDCKMSKPVKLSSLVPVINSCAKLVNTKIVNGSIPPNSETELDNDTLLAILEGTTDINDVSWNATSTPKGENNKKRKKRVKPVLDPNVEKELALKQLMDFETKKNREKSRRNSKKTKIDTEANSVSQQNGNATENNSDGAENGDTNKGEAEKKVVKRNLYTYSSAPKRFPKKYQRIIKRQLRSSKLKTKCTNSPEQQKKLPEVPEVQIAIDRYFKTYASKRKFKPENKTSEKAGENKLKEDAGADTSTIDENIKDQQIQVSNVESDENRNEMSASDQEIKKENETLSSIKSKTSSKVMREINRLLGDEGAINMIYSIEQKRLPDSKRDTNILPSLRRKKKDLLLKTKLVKNAVLRLSMSSSQSGASRVRRSSPETSEVIANAASPLRKASIESMESNVSEHSSPKVRKVAAEASKIIRRHSSSSCYSSEDEEKETSPSLTVKNKEVISPVENNNTISEEISPKTIILETEISPKKNIADVSVTSPVQNTNNESLKKEIQIVTKDITVSKGKSPKSSRRESREGIYGENKNQTEVVTNNINVEIPEQISLNEITVRKYDNLVQIILTSSSTKMKNALNTQILREFISVLNELQKDENCKTVLVTSTGSSFCQGIDLQTLVCSDTSERSKIVNECISILTNFAKCLSHFPKLLIAGVHGSAVGLGVTMLPFFDMVFASDKATFYTPYAKLGQIPEAGATLTLPHLLGNAVTSELLFGCRMLTATEALQFGLVTRILWPDKFSEELLPLTRGIANHSSQSMEATKLLLRQGMNSKLEEQLKIEANILQEHWCSEECQSRFKQYLEQEALLQNK